MLSDFQHQWLVRQPSLDGGWKLEAVKVACGDDDLQGEPRMARKKSTTKGAGLDKERLAAMFVSMGSSRCSSSIVNQPVACSSSS